MVDFIHYSSYKNIFLKVHVGLNVMKNYGVTKPFKSVSKASLKVIDNNMSGKIFKNRKTNYHYPYELRQGLELKF